jgi:hypothetical protein
MPYWSHAPWFHYPNNIWRRIFSSILLCHPSQAHIFS